MDGAGTVASRSLTLLLAAACGLIAANVYYAQPLAGSIGPAIGLSPEASGLVVTLMQVGYGAGLLLIVPLGDLIENRLLVTSVVGITCLAPAAAAWSSNAVSFLPSILLVGLGSVAVQILIPYASHLTPPETRGTLVGNVTSSLMAGVMLSRPASSWIASVSNWRVVFLSSPATMLALAIALAVQLPPRTLELKSTYSAPLASMGGLALKSSVLRQRVIYQCFLYAAFSVFWTTIPMRLMGGSRAVARVWVDSEYRERLRQDATGAIAELGFSGQQGEYMVVVEQGPKVHNLVVCTPCSCYPRPVLGFPPAWYKSGAYRSRAAVYMGLWLLPSIASTATRL